MQRIESAQVLPFLRLNLEVNLLRVEQVVVIIALLNHPDYDEEYDVEKVLLEIEVADRCAHPGPVQPAEAVD